MERHNVLLGTEFEELIGFSRAVRVGPMVVVGGIRAGCGSVQLHPI